MDLSISYLGLTLRNPLMPGASPLADRLDTVRALEDAGASAIVLRSLFEEQISTDYTVEPDRYLEQIRKIKEAVKLPVIGSLNGSTAARWLEYGRQLQEAGADAIELNFYHVATDANESGAAVEQRLLDAVRALRSAVDVPIAVKLAPFFSSLPHLASQISAAGANGLVLFNRFYQPDLDPEMLESVPTLALSTSDELLLRVRWLAILSGRTTLSLAATGGVHSGTDAIKVILAGAHAVQVVSALLREGTWKMRAILRELQHWLEAHGYESLQQAHATVSLSSSPNPQAFERGNYLRMLRSWRGDA